MAIYKLVNGKGGLAEVDRTTFGEEGVLERADLQRILRDQPEVLEEGLLIIAEEFGDWEDSNRRIDLLGLDASGRLVVVELKRGETGRHMELQALRYAAMVANMTYQQAVDTFQAYLDKRAGEDGRAQEEDDAESRIQEHIGIAEPDSEAVLTKVPRLILVSENFGKELKTCVMWLNESWLRDAGREIKCIRLQPHRNGEELLIETSVVIPLPEASDYQTRLGRREQEARAREQEARGTQVVPGREAFEESFASVEEKHQQGLQRLYKCARDLESRNLAELFTYIRGDGSRYVRLELRIPGSTDKLVSFNSLLYRGGLASITTWQGWEKYAPEALKRIDKLIGPVTSPAGVRHRRLSTTNTAEKLDSILTVIEEAYQEASENASDGTEYGG